MYNITLIEGDGIGPEISKSVVEIIKKANVEINWDKQQAGKLALEKYGSVLPSNTIESIKSRTASTTPSSTTS